MKTIEKFNTLSDRMYPEANLCASQAGIAYEIDRARIIHTQAFRRLQDKRQVLSTASGDFHRTRLTHTLEVAQIARLIAAKLYKQQTGHELIKNFVLLQDKATYFNLIESIALLHDIGHPPFGHGGEEVLNDKMRQHGGFEANAQTLRIIARLENYASNPGMNLTRRTMLGILKYPIAHSVAHKGEPQVAPKPVKCFYDLDLEIVAWLYQVFSANDVSKIQTHRLDERVLVTTFDCRLMELADDIAYALGDLEDSISLGLLTEKTFLEVFNLHLPHSLENFVTENYALSLQNICNWSWVQTNLRYFTAILVDYFVNCIVVLKRDKFNHPILRYTLALGTMQARHLLDNIKNLVMQHVILAPENISEITAGQKVIAELFDFYSNHPDKLPDNTKSRLDSAMTTPTRIICDYVSGMTDRYVLRQYNRHLRQG